ncbi:hypothetical protein OPV09_21010 [Janthinobacterium sp. TB1-E2]|uniref:PKD/Chitinase domain-containing protein n=1 Tax=Janthinobacterium aestuarii TaxID=2985511 RepID=A0ABZ2GHC3_9BURK
MRSRMQGPVVRWLGVGMLVMVMLAGCGGGGGGGGGGNDTISPPPVNTAPKAAVYFAGTVSNGSNGADATATTGADVVLDASGSSDAEGDVLSYIWSLVAKPAGSAYVPVTPTGVKLSIKPDVLGNYVFNLRVTDSKGAFSDKSVTVIADNTPPNAVTVIRATFTAVPVNQPPLTVSVGSGVALDASGSTDVDGDVVSTTWQLITKPVDSMSTLYATGQGAVFSPDVMGMYQVRAHTTDGKGAYADTVYQISAANRAPVGVIRGTVAVISRDTQMVPIGQPVVTSGILSYDEGGAPLSYAWAVDTRPSGSVAVVGAAMAAIPAFTPDVAGAYVLSLTVSNGRQTAVAYLKLNAVTSTSSVVALPFKPVEMRYSQAVDRLVVVTAEPYTIKVINPVDGATTSIDLPTAVKTFNLSPDGKLAAVLHDGVVSLVDLVSGSLLKSSGTGGMQTEVFVTNAGVVFLSGQSTVSYARPAVAVINARTGQAMPSLEFGNSGFYGALRGVFAASKNKAFLSQGNYATLSYFTIDPQTHAILTNGTVYSDYYISSPFFLSPKEDLLFTANGTYFSTDTLQYMGRFTFGSSSSGGSNSMQAMSYSPARAEVLLMESSLDYAYPANDTVYQTSYKKYSGELLFPAGSVSLPVIGGEQSYGIGIFHTAAGDPVALVQTGGAQKGTARAKYYLVYR